MPIRRFTFRSALGLVFAAVLGCSQSPLSNDVLIKVTSSNSSESEIGGSLTSGSSGAEVVQSSFLNDFDRIKQEFDHKITMIEEKFTTQFLDPATSFDVQNQLRVQLQAECKNAAATVVPKVFELVKSHLTEPAAFEPLLWLAEHDDGAIIGQDAAALLLDAIKRHSTDEASVAPLIWLVNRKSDTRLGQDALTLLIEHHLMNPKTIELTVRPSAGPWIERVLRAQLASSDLPDEQRPHVILALARHLKESAQWRNGGEAKLDEAVQLYGEVEQNYADQLHRTGLKLGDLASAAVFEIQNLSIGKQAPEIEGEDLNKVAFKLSDYRGKVVMLSYWASWCGPCMAMVSQERELVERYDGRPFVLIGINGDMDRESVIPLIEQEKITWRSFWAGEKGPFGPIPLKWNVNSWPTVYLIDHAGIIKSKRLDVQTLETLVVDAEKSLDN